MAKKVCFQLAKREESIQNYVIMESIELQPLINNYYRKIAKIDLRFKRYQ